MQVTDEQMDIILFSKSSFIIGRSGTGKTTILTMKLFQNEESFRIASEGIYAAESSRVRDVQVLDDSEENEPTVLRQLFVTVSPKLCYAVKQHVSHLTSIACKGNSSTDVNLDDADVTSEFRDIPDTFVDILHKNYPLVVTFDKFLMMLDGTLGDSFFERFPEARGLSYGSHMSSRSVALQTFLRSKKVTFERFCSLYWPHFNSNLTKKLDASRVFTEIISHIKGGLQAGESSDGKLSYEGYSLLSESCASTLTKEKREIVYNLFQAYEKMKTERGEFDMGDLVNDLHYRLSNEKYEGDQMDFIYIDEVQDLSMRQISLFKYICQNVDEGFVFAGDTAQTIARGIDFRFQDIRSLFYNEFLSNRTTEKREKGVVSEIFQLKQNFRTHAGVLELAQSVIEILYCYFAHSIDVLEPETSLISGEAPVLLESGNDENAIVTIFCGNGGGTGGEIVGFGAEQVILVRDDCAKTEICEYVGKQALVLTLVECKGLEFQDVLLYNFFGTSPMKDQWRVIYGYMKEKNLVDEKGCHSFPSFSEARHNVLCSELKQLYVAITRTRQRLWICENREELSKPMFDYWKRRGLVQLRKLDDSVAQAMRVASNPQEWRERGKKLYYENNFVMATMCFERAGDKMWEILARASGIRTSAEQMRGTNPEAASGYLREAAAMFESIGKLEPAASCYCDLGEYQRAGRIYLDMCGQADAAAECFTLAGCYSDAAEAYAKGDQFSNCLSVCKKGKLFDKGMQYIEHWKEHANVQNKELELIKQDLLETCALDYHKRKDPKSMMKFVRAFCSMETKRVFLRSVGCLDELSLLEEESGNFVEAAELVRSWGDVLKEADLLEKVGQYKDATLLILWYVFYSSLWGNGSTGWPLKQFAQKEQLCKKAKSLSEKVSENFYGFVCRELRILSDQQISLPELKKHLQASQEHESLRGEIVSIRKILDAHLKLNSSKYDWEDELPVDLKKHAENKIFWNRVSVRTLVFYWNMWKDNVMDIFQSLESVDSEERNEHFEFCLDYFGVKKQCVNGNMVYLLVSKDVDWLRNGGHKDLHVDGKRLTFDSRQLVVAIRLYWQLELVSVGIKVLETLETLNKLMSQGSAFRKSTCLLYIFEVSKFLLDCCHLNLTYSNRKTLENFLGMTQTYFDLAFPLDWRCSISGDFVSLKETDLSVNLLEEIINFNVKGNITYWTIGRVMMTCLGSRKPLSLYDKILTGLQWNPFWKSFVVNFWNGCSKDVYVALQNALQDTFRANWRLPGYISPHSFVYLLDRLFFMVSFSSRIFFTTRSSFVEWFTHPHLASTPSTTFSEPDFSFFVGIVHEILYNQVDTVAWIQKSDINPKFYHPVLVLKLVMILCLICLKEPDCSQVLLDLLFGRNNIGYLLPKEFLNDLIRRKKGRYLNLIAYVVADAFINVDDPLLIVSMENGISRIYAPCALFVDLSRSREEIMSILFPNKNTHSGWTSNKVGIEVSSSNASPDANFNVNSVDGCKGELLMNWEVMDIISEVINGETGEIQSSFSDATTIKKELDKIVHALATALENAKTCAGEDATLLREVRCAFDELKLLCCWFDISGYEVGHLVFTRDETNSLQQVVEGLQSRRPMIDDLLKQSGMSEEPQKVVSESRNTSVEEETANEDGNDDNSQVPESVPRKQMSGGNTEEAGSFLGFFMPSAKTLKKYPYAYFLSK
ncbi:hypothetical protein L6452_13734 [Arctium lappa]|uniref:Uncharacterized protein n=1 Tax=Arctium lappa TaxID=4217 RepID=A0ACB9CJ43_ARCLA|nr:hypothetical protein L6452_13734 [Arctium lappa]